MSVGPQVPNNVQCNYCQQWRGCYVCQECCAGRVQAASAVPSSFIASQVPMPSAFTAAPAQGCALIAAKPASLVSGGHAPLAGAGLTTASVPPATPMFFDPNGPRIQGGHIVGNTCAGGNGPVQGHRKGSQLHPLQETFQLRAQSFSE